MKQETTNANPKIRVHCHSFLYILNLMLSQICTYICRRVRARTHSYVTYIFYIIHYITQYN